MDVGEEYCLIVLIIHEIEISMHIFIGAEHRECKLFSVAYWQVSIQVLLVMNLHNSSLVMLCSPWVALAYGWYLVTRLIHWKVLM